MTITEPWTCPTCESTVSTRYCPECGESPPLARDLTLGGLFHQFVQAFSSIDGRLLRSFRCLVAEPGALTVAYVQGRRMPYLGPFVLFVIANVLFFAVQSMTHTNVVSTTLDSHLHNQDWHELAQRLVADRLETRRTTLESYAPLFDRAIVFYAKSFIIAMVLPFALVLPLFFHRHRQPFAVHVVFSLHFYTFVLLLFCVSLAIAGIDVLLGGAGLKSARMDAALSLFNLTACAAYLYLATGRAYGATGGMRVFKALALAAAVTGILLGYRFAVFLLTLYVT